LAKQVFHVHGADDRGQAVDSCLSCRSGIAKSVRLGAARPGRSLPGACSANGDGANSESFCSDTGSLMIQRPSLVLSLVSRRSGTKLATSGGTGRKVDATGSPYARHTESPSLVLGVLMATATPIAGLKVVRHLLPVRCF
jgi:hypothetical protein